MVLIGSVLLYGAVEDRVQMRAARIPMALHEYATEMGRDEELYWIWRTG